MKNINLFDKLLDELYKIFKGLGINYIYKIYTSENGTALCCYTGETHIVFIHKEMNDLYHSVYGRKIKLDHSCVLNTEKVVENRNYYFSYNGIGNFKVINGEALKDYHSDEKNVINIELLYDRSMPDLLFELLIALHYYRTSDGKKFSSIMKPDFTITEDFFKDLRKISLQQYTYPGFTKGEFIENLWHRREEAAFYRNFSPNLLHMISHDASNRCNNLLNKRMGVRAILTSGYIPVTNPAIMAINIKRMNGEKLDGRLKSMKLGCIYGKMPDSYSIIVDTPYLRFTNDPNKEFIFIDSEVFVEIAELMESVMSRNKGSVMNSAPFPYDEELESIIKYGLHDNMTPFLRKKFYNSVLQKILEWMEEIKLSPYRSNYIDKLAESIDLETNIYLQRILYNIQKNVSEEIRVYIEEMLQSLIANISTADTNFSLNDLSLKCSSYLERDKRFLEIFRIFSNKNNDQKEKKVVSSDNQRNSSENSLIQFTSHSNFSMIFPESLTMSTDNNLSNVTKSYNVTKPYDVTKPYNYYVLSTVLAVFLVLPAIIMVFNTFVRKVLNSITREKSKRTIVIDPEVITLDYCPRR